MTRRRQIQLGSGQGLDPGAYNLYRGLVEQINGAFADIAVLQKAGASSVLLNKCDELTFGQTWVRPAGVNWILVEAQAAGGGGGGRDTAGAGRPGGGGAGEFKRFWLRVTSDILVLVGVSGAGGASAAGFSVDGTDGGDVSVGAVTVKGGPGGKRSIGAANGASGAGGGAFGPAGVAATLAGADAITSFDTTSGATGSGGASAGLRGGRCANNLGGATGNGGAGGGGASALASGGNGASTTASAVQPGYGGGGGAAEDLTHIAVDGGNAIVRIYYYQMT